MPHTIPTILVNSQPWDAKSMDVETYCVGVDDEKTTHSHELRHYERQLASEDRNGQCESSSKCCRSSRLLCGLLRAAVILLAIAAALAFYTDTGDALGRGLGGLTKRDTGDVSSSGPFVDQRLYFIVIFVGLLIVIMLGILLSAWCCKAAFDNPCCCPCYLCACCGGLACLECIGSGICGEA